MKTVNQRFDEKCLHAESGCIEWISNKSHNGYGLFKAFGKQIRAHRFAFERANGLIPAGMLICHKCDNPSCVNPEHLFSGTASDNAIDCVNKGRKRWAKVFSDQKCGNNLNAKLTSLDVAEIRRLFCLGDCRRDLAAKFGVHYNTIKAIIRCETWVGVGHV